MTTPPQSQVKERMDCVQLLRGVAAVAVVTHHIPLFRNGAWGVDLFFIISGFIMCYVTEESGRGFLTKRIIRVVPLYWAGTIGAFCVALVAPQFLNNTTANGVHLLKSILFIPFLKGREVQPVLFLGWTLNYEMFFYGLFALSMALSHKYRALIASVLLLVVVAIGYVVTFEALPLRFFTRPIILEFVLGMLCYGLFRKTMTIRAQERSATVRTVWSVLGVALIACMPLATVLAPDENRVIVWGIPAALAFIFVVQGLSGVRLPRSLVLIGDASYSLYLFHPYLIHALGKFFPALYVRNAQGYLMACMALLLCCGLAVLSYWYVERPVTEALRRRFVGEK